MVHSMLRARFRGPGLPPPIRASIQTWQARKRLPKLNLRASREIEPNHVHSRYARQSKSDDKRPFHIHGGFRSMMLHPVTPVTSQEIKTKTVFTTIIFVKQPQA